MWIDPNNRIVSTRQGQGAPLTHDHGKSFIYFDNLPLSQSFTSRGPRDQRHLPGLQDNGTWGR
jgi:hypothetical protein